uniref:mRNA interferase RelE/StbE n=1 Tax=Candidatus Kentrum sp. SD TaxID=2126332 RepID=A0A451BKW3_9GAMM|nr:MAG: mRNA interferase RelE/StbE [Candidatus Kentron sp. SD]VFK44222.1 MAG: mRNA interferase RelE/StbE [Candidatus Kentron sp. SD]VFK78927.1 MAG: mRNA interferase RelE/StbE [Candidatus Kentron sp. SD]
MKLIYTERAAKDIRRLPPDIKRRLGTTLARYRDFPYLYARKLNNPHLGNYRFRMGSYRIMFDIEDDAMVILRVGHRRDIYRG